MDESVQRIALGDVEIIRVVEWAGEFITGRELVPDAPAELWQDNAGWLAPDHWNPESGLAGVTLQSWVVRSGGRTVLVDTGVGNGRERPGNPLFHRREGEFLGRLAAVGVKPEEVDVVVNTHIHADHVGWNTRDADGAWVPTFPQARYLLPAADVHHFGPENGYAKGARPDDRLIFEDSIAPVIAAGQAEVWDGHHRIDEHLSLESAPGHTPGSAVLRLASGGDRAVFVGDLLHSPVQILAPSCSSCLCLDPAGAAASRRRILGQAAELGELVIPAHFGGTGAVEVRRDGGEFTLGRWVG